MITRRLLLASATALAFAAPAFAQEKLRVIATFSILGDIVANVGGDPCRPPPVCAALSFFGRRSH